RIRRWRAIWAARRFLNPVHRRIPGQLVSASAPHVVRNAAAPRNDAVDSDGLSFPPTSPPRNSGLLQSKRADFRSRPAQAGVLRLTGVLSEEGAGSSERSASK